MRHAAGDGRDRRVVDGLSDALDRRDPSAVAALLSPDVVVRAPRLGGPWHGADAVLDALGRLWELCERSRFVVREVVVDGDATRDAVVVAVRSSHAVTTEWVVGVGTLTVTARGGLVSAADLDLDVDALRDQWRGSQTAAASVRSEIALAGFDPDATVVADVRVVPTDDPPARSAARRAVVPAVVGLVLLAAVGAAALSRSGSSSPPSGSAAATPVTSTPSASEAASGSATVSASPSATPSPTQILGPSAVATSGGGVRTTLSGTLLFERDSAVVLPSARQQVAALATTLRGVPGGRLQVLGYTDDLGSAATSRTLSLARARAVAALFAADLPGTRISITATGLGSSNPVAPNDSEANRAKNRRVEIVYYPS